MAYLFNAAWAVPPISPTAQLNVASAIVLDMDTDAILFEQNPDLPIPPASLTKIMSMFLARDFVARGLADFSTSVDVSAAAAAEAGSRMGLRKGESVPLDRLLLGMAVSSGNDASHAVAEFVGGSVASFVRQMNIRARELGMNDSMFKNPHGLPAEGQYTTARDMLALARAYLRAYPDALQMHNTPTLTHRGYTSWNKNPLLGQYPGADGLKSGWIRASGYNLVFTAQRGDHRILAVILGAPDSITRGGEACRLLDAGFLVCGNSAVSVAAALENLPYDASRIEPRKIAKDAGLLKKQPTRSARVFKGRPIRTKAVASAASKNLSKRKAGAKSSKKASTKVVAAKVKKNSVKSAAAKKNSPGISKKGRSARSQQTAKAKAANRSSDRKTHAARTGQTKRQRNG